MGIVAVGEKIYAIGGRDGNGTLPTVEIYDTTTNSWTSGASMPAPRREFGIGVAQGKIYVVGGYDGSNILSSVLEYDPAGNTWTSKSPMPAPREGLSVAVVNDTLYAIGGDDGSITLNTVEAYDPVADLWISRAAMPTARTLLTCQEFGGKIYAMGGNDTGVNATGALEVYDPESNSWSTKAALMPRYGLSSAVVDEKIYTLGGFIGVSVVAVVQSYDTASNSWSSEAQLLTARWGLGSDAIGNRIYAIGGQTLFHSGYTGVNEVGTVEVTGVTITAFASTGCRGHIVISWRIESEASIVMYLLRRKQNADQYSEIFKIAGSGSSPSFRSYSFTDEDVRPGVRYFYKLGVVAANGNTIWFGPVSAVANGIAGDLAVSPNPMRESSLIRFTVIEHGNISLAIRDISGRLVRRLFEGEGSPGSYSIIWNGEDDFGNRLPSSIYICVMKAGVFSQREKLLLID